MPEIEGRVGESGSTISMEDLRQGPTAMPAAFLCFSHEIGNLGDPVGLGILFEDVNGHAL
ncbi:hypothetical protein Taro_001693 [Colocasia esculenta]|uniref:Uncharacterized protein n=1 Tax=Colocasia esculenta TaxID=4460 RepID=A0A843TIM1_COLES|nr:hypothetical protein [Colocasia esculenta]